MTGGSCVVWGRNADSRRSERPLEELFDVVASHTPGVSREQPLHAQRPLGQFVDAVLGHAELGETVGDTHVAAQVRNGLARVRPPSRGYCRDAPMIPGLGIVVPVGAVVLRPRRGR